MSTPFRATSLKLNKELSKEVRQEQGIFFTPAPARALLFETVRGLGVTAPRRILEPSFGSGEFLVDAREAYPGAQIVGCELNAVAYKAVAEGEGAAAAGGPSLVLAHQDFLTYSPVGKFDLIIGNPPYFVIKDKNPACMTGRPNIYVAFLYKCLEQHLADDGVLAFVLPTSLFNCSYYEPMRRYIAERCTVCLVKELDVTYYQTAQDTMLLVLRKRVDPTKAFILERNGCVYLTPHATELAGLVAGATNLKEIGWSVKTGDVVWNQEKEKLVDGPDEGATLLIYSTNIVKGEGLVVGNIVDKKGEKKQYIKGFKKAPVRGPAILANRGYGNTYSFNYVAVEEGREFFAENHVNMILPGTGVGSAEHLEAILASFADARTARFVELFFGNGAVSKTELEQVLPIYL